MDRRFSFDEPLCPELFPGEFPEDQLFAELMSAEPVPFVPPEQLSSTADNPTMNRRAFEQTGQQIAPMSYNSDGTLLSPNFEALGDVGNHQSVAAAPAAINKPGGSSGLPNGREELIILHQKGLDIASAAAASAEAPFVVGSGSSGPVDLAGSHSGSRVPVQGSKHKDTGGSVTIPALPAREKSVAQTKITTSGSEQSVDDELDGENEMTQYMDPTHVKHVKRMHSNRESARRSRMKKKARLDELETQVSEVNTKNSSLLERLTDMSTKYNDIAAENRLLKADVEIMRAKLQVKITEMSEICTTMPPYRRNADTGCRIGVAE